MDRSVGIGNGPLYRIGQGTGHGIGWGTSDEIRRALKEPVDAIVEAVKGTLDKTPPELAADIMDRGIVLTGGGGLLRGLDERLRHETGIPIHLAENPLASVVLGSGKCLEEFETLKKVMISSTRR